jgi:hypothetical protein
MRTRMEGKREFGLKLAIDGRSSDQNVPDAQN